MQLEWRSKTNNDKIAANSKNAVDQSGLEDEICNQRYLNAGKRAKT